MTISTTGLSLCDWVDSQVSLGGALLDKIVLCMGLHDYALHEDPVWIVQLTFSLWITLSGLPRLTLLAVPKPTCDPATASIRRRLSLDCFIAPI